MQLLRAVSHPNILPLLGVYSKVCPGSVWAGGPRQGREPHAHPDRNPPPCYCVQGFGITLVFPLCRTDLHRMLEAGPLSPPAAKTVLRQLFGAVGALHNAGRCSRGPRVPGCSVVRPSAPLLRCMRAVAPMPQSQHQQRSLHPSRPWRGPHPANRLPCRLCTPRPGALQRAADRRRAGDAVRLWPGPAPGGGAGGGRRAGCGLAGRTDSCRRHSMVRRGPAWLTRPSPLHAGQAPASPATPTRGGLASRVWVPCPLALHALHGLPR